MTIQEIKDELAKILLSTDKEEYWREVEIARDNATDYIIDLDDFLRRIFEKL